MTDENFGSQKPTLPFLNLTVLLLLLLYIFHTHTLKCCSSSFQFNVLLWGRHTKKGSRLAAPFVRGRVSCLIRFLLISILLTQQQQQQQHRGQIRRPVITRWNRTHTKKGKPVGEEESEMLNFWELRKKKKKHDVISKWNSDGFK
jgi:hypothetical protein